jgi:hypothetical protein
MVVTEGTEDTEEEFVLCRCTAEKCISVFSVPSVATIFFSIKIQVGPHLIRPEAEAYFIWGRSNVEKLVYI